MHLLHLVLRLWNRSKALVLFALVSSFSALWTELPAQAIIIDHNCTNLSAIPENYIHLAKQNLCIAYGHTSHGSQITTGMTGLANWKGSLYAWNGSGSNGALRLIDYYGNFGGLGANDLGSPNRTAWASATRTYLAANPHVNVIIWSWCGQVDGTQADIQQYLDLMDGLEDDFPNVKFVYMTGHLNGGGAAGNVNLRNNQIRAYCQANGKILYDFADIESYDPDGSQNYMDLLANDQCYYDSDEDGSRDRNWAIDWQDAHDLGVDWYSCSSAHSQPLNANRKAYAAWHLWARLAGWSGQTGLDTIPPTVPDGLSGEVLSATEVSLSWNASTDNVGVAGYRVFRNGVSLGTTASTAYIDSGLQPTTSYNYSVSAYDSTGNESVICAPVTITTSAASGGVSGLQVSHHGGQTVLTWNEVPEVASVIPETMTVGEVKAMRTAMNGIRYRIYRSNSQINSVAGRTPVKEVSVLRGWNSELYGMDNNQATNGVAYRFVVEADVNGVPGVPVARDVAVFAMNPPSAGTGYYAVTVVRDGVEDTSLSSANRLSVQETVGQGEPILQRVVEVEDHHYTEGISRHYYYTRWECPPHSSIIDRPIDYRVAVPPHYNPQNPMPVLLSDHGWGGNLSSLSWWMNFESGSILVSTNQEPYDWWTGYHELRGIVSPSQSAWSQGVVRPYTQRRINAFYDWVCDHWNVDRSRAIWCGVSMGGSGSIMHGIRNPDRVAWVNSWVGVHVPAESPTFRSSYEGSYGQLGWNILFEDGITPAFSWFDDDWYLRNHLADETPFISFSNGKNDSGIGWSQAVKFLRALQDTKRPFTFDFGMSGHNQRALNPPNIDGVRSESVNPIDIRTCDSLPAFNNCSLDDDPGNGDPADGDESGQINAYLYWDTRNIVSYGSEWEMTIGLVQTAPSDSCTVSLTPRRANDFLVSAGESCSWTNTDIASGQVIQQGTVQADPSGLVTIDNLIVNQITRSGGGNRIRIVAGEIPNASPVLAPIGNRSVQAGQTIQITVYASDADGDPLQLSATGE